MAFSAELQALLPQLAQQPAAAADQLRALADGGDEEAAVLAAWSLMQAGRWPEGIPYAERAAERGAIQIAANYVGNLAGQPEHRESFLRLLRLTLAQGWPVDPLGWLPTLVQRGDHEGAAELVELATSGGSVAAGAEHLVQRVRRATDTFDALVGDVTAAKDGAVRQIQEQQELVDTEAKRLQDLGHKVERVAHAAAADELSKQYAAAAKSNNRAAAWFTGGAIAVGAIAAGIAAYFTLVQIDGSPDVAAGLAKAGVAIPIALLAGFLGQLASRFRQMAWRQTHVELQLRTAESYIAELEQEQRLRVVESLAMRFFPGQPQAIDGAPERTDDRT